MDREIDDKLLAELRGLDHFRGYRPGFREQEFENWMDDLRHEAVAGGYQFVQDGPHVEFWDDDELVDSFDFESVLDHPARERW